LLAESIEWWDLPGTIDSDNWQWNGNANPTDCDGNRVLSIIGYV